MSVQSPIVIGTVPYLNARPLVRWFWDTDEGRASGVRVVEAVPSELAKRLAEGEFAAALVSSFELFRRPGLCHAPGIAVGAGGAVHSVRLLSRLPVEQVRTVALDTSSLTSVALLKILLTERYGLSPRYVPCAPNLAEMLETAEAALLIGDLGYRDYERFDLRLRALDLGAAWREMTGLPFVYALWIGPVGRLGEDVVALLERAKEWGTVHLPEIACAEYNRLGETYERCLHYLRDVMRYDLGPRERKALSLFGDKAWRHGLLARPSHVDACTADPAG